MSVKTYSLKADGDKQLSHNFKVREFRCKDGSDKILISSETVEKLQAAADYFKKPIYINSAYRTPAWNAKQGGASKSQHVLGTACDIRIDSVPSSAVAAFFEDYYPKSGIGLYDTFTHIDSRGKKSYWKGASVKVVSTFGLKDSYKKYKGEDDMTDKQVESIAEKVIKAHFDNLKKQPPSAWSENARKYAEGNEIIKGDTNGDKRYKMYVTREEVTEMMYELSKVLVTALKR